MLAKSLPVLALATMLPFGPALAEALKPEPLLDYAKVCQAFGPGFTNLPGTEICVKVSGYVKVGTSAGHSDVSGLFQPVPKLHLPK